MIPRTAITMSKKEVLALLVVFVVYVVLGGAVFMALEGPTEEELRLEITEIRRNFHEKLSVISHPNLSSAEITEIIFRLADARSKNLLDEEGRDTHINWNFYNSFFFAITVVTTIGYGHLAPSTVWGRIFCVLYAVVGVPMTGILLAAIGDHFSRGLESARRRNRQRSALGNPHVNGGNWGGNSGSRLALAGSAAAFLLPWLVVFLLLPAAVFKFIEDWTYLEGLYYCFITLATIGFGDYVAGNFDGDYIWIYKTGVVLWIIFGLGYLAMILNYISRAMRCKQIRRMENRLSTSFHNTQQRFGQRLDEIQKILQDFSTKKSHKRSIWRNKNGKQVPKDMSTESLPVHDKNHNRDDQIQRLLTLVETLKRESTQNLSRTRQLIEEHNRRLYEMPYVREDSCSSGGLPRGEAAPSRRHSLPVLLTDSEPSTPNYLQVNMCPAPARRSHIEIPNNFYSPRASIPMYTGGRYHEMDACDDVYDVEIAITRPIVTFDLDSMDSTTI
ncbi:potassium channel subfamily K member 4-like isoform X2 [Ornithodoros turicata]